MAKENNARERYKQLVNPTGSRKATSMANLSVAVTFSLLTMVITKVVGFVREIFVTQKFVYGAYSDGFYLGFAIPDLFYDMLIGGVLAAAITPTLAAAIEHNEEERHWKAISIFFSLSAVLMIFIMLAGSVFMRPLLDFFYGGQSLEIREVAAVVGRIIFLQAFFFILIGEVTAVLSANKEFVAPNIGNTIYNIGCLFSILLFAQPSTLAAGETALGIVVSAGLYFAFLFYFAKPYMSYFKFSLNVRDRDFWRLMRIALPAVVAGTFNQLNFIVQQSFSNQFEGAVTSLNQAKQLYNLPYGLISAGIGTVVVANLSGFYARRAMREARAFLTTSLRMALFLLMPFVVMFTVARFETAQAVYQWNVQSYEDSAAQATGGILAVFAINMVLLMLNFFYTQTFYAMKKSFIALVTGGLTMVMNPLMCYVYTRYFGMGLEGIALAAVSYNVVNFVAINLLLRYYEPEFLPQKMSGFGLQLLGSSAIAALAVLAVRRILPFYDRKMSQLLVYVVLGLVCVLSYFVASYFLRVTESRAFVGRLSGRFKKLSWAEAVAEEKAIERVAADEGVVPEEIVARLADENKLDTEATALLSESEPELLSDAESEWPLAVEPIPAAEAAPADEAVKVTAVPEAEAAPCEAKEDADS